MRVLVIDDDEISCRFLAELLVGAGLEAAWTTSGLEGYEMSRQEIYDAFVIDVRMPLVLGTELADALKENDPAAKIILISAFADGRLLELASHLGVTLLSKPFDSGSLLAALANGPSNRDH